MLNREPRYRKKPVVIKEGGFTGIFTPEPNPIVKKTWENKLRIYAINGDWNRLLLIEQEKSWEGYRTLQVINGAYRVYEYQDGTISYDGEWFASYVMDVPKEWRKMDYGELLEKTYEFLIDPKRKRNWMGA